MHTVPGVWRLDCSVPAPMASRTEIHSARSSPWRSSAGLMCLALTMLALARPAPVMAALGGNETSVQSDRAQMRAALLRMTRAERYTVHEMQAPSGTIVREYVSTTGAVFAVAWTGPWQPDLRQVLGTYFEQYVQAARVVRARRAGHGPLLLQEPGLVVQLSGHPRAFEGKAYVPMLIPQGLGIDIIR
jgi:Protein of unknown function (DUF2844)